MSENLQDKAAQQAVNYFQISELQLAIFIIIVLIIWSLSTYFLQNRLQKNLMKDIESYKENVEKRLREIDYKRDYYRKIIDKRLDAYAKLQNYIGYIAISRPILNPDKRDSIGDGVSIYDCFFKKEELNVASEKTLKILNFAPWFSDDVANSLYSLNKILCDAQTVINHPSTENLGYYKLNENILANPNWHLNIAVIVYNEMHEHITVIKKGLLRDIKTINNVEVFLNSKS